MKNRHPEEVPLGTSEGSRDRSNISFFPRLLLSLLLAAAGYGILVYTVPIVRIFGKMPLVERAGEGLTYLAWKLIGVALWIVAVMLLFNRLPVG